MCIVIFQRTSGLCHRLFLHFRLLSLHCGAIDAYLAPTSMRQKGRRLCRNCSYLSHLFFWWVKLSTPIASERFTSRSLVIMWDSCHGSRCDSNTTNTNPLEGSSFAGGTVTGTRVWRGRARRAVRGRWDCDLGSWQAPGYPQSSNTRSASPARATMTAARTPSSSRCSVS